MKERWVLPEVRKLNENDVFVFGSNLRGIPHGGASYVAHAKFGAEFGVVSGLTGQSYAIPVCDAANKPLKPNKIEPYITEFLDFAWQNSELTFHVSLIGCGFAGFKPKNIAPFFAEAYHLDNVLLPRNFWYIIGTFREGTFKG